MQRFSFVEPILFVFFFNMGVDMFTSKQLIYRKICLNTFNETYCNTLSESNNDTFSNDKDLIQQHTARWLLYLNVARSLPAVLVTMFLGSWSDLVGRRVVLILPIFGDLCSYIVMFMSSYYVTSSLKFLFIGSIVSGSLGNVCAVMQACFAYVADISSTESRTKRIAFLEFLVNVGKTISTTIAGLLLKNYGFVAVYGLVLSLTVLQMLYWWLLKESSDMVVRCKLSDLFSIKRLKETLSVATMNRNRKRRNIFYALMVAFAADFLVLLGVMSVLVLYLLHQPLSFTSPQIGYFFTEINATRSLGILIMNLVFINIFHWRDPTFIILGAVSYIGLSISLAISVELWQVFAGGVFALLSGMGMPATRGYLSKIVSPNEQGCMFSFLSGFEVLVSLLAGMMFSMVYENSVEFLPSLTFYLMAAFACVELIFGFCLKRLSVGNCYYTLDEEEPHSNSVNS